MNKLPRAAVFASLAIALPGCGDLVPSTPDQSKVVLNGHIVPDQQITAKDCDILSRVDYPTPPKKITPETEQTYEAGLSMASFEEAKLASLDNDLPKALTIAGSLIREAAANNTSDTDLLVVVEAKRFVANPKENQLALKAACASYAGEISTAEAILSKIQNTRIKSGANDDVEVWESSHAEQAAQNKADFDTAYKLLDLIDDKGTVTRVDAQDDVENWVGFHAEQMAESSASGAKKALKLVDGLVDLKGTQTRPDIRDDVENWVEGQATELAMNGHDVQASELASMVDNVGRYTRAAVQKEVDDIITG